MAKYIIAIDWGYDGWSVLECDSLQEALDRKAVDALYHYNHERGKREYFIAQVIEAGEMEGRP